MTNQRDDLNYHFYNLRHVNVIFEIIERYLGSVHFREVEKFDINMHYIFKHDNWESQEQ